MKAIIYRRVSTGAQAESGASLDAQLEKMRAYCMVQDLEIVEEITDAGESAKSLNRPGIRQAVAMLRSGEADVMVIYKLDRLTRSLSDWAYLVENVFNEKGAALMSVTDSIDTRTASGRLVLNLLVTVSQWEREAISERTRVALAQRKAEGVRLGAPKGRKAPNQWEPSPEEKAAVLEIMQANPGASLRQIAAALNERGITRGTIREVKDNGLTVSERPAMWHPQTVARFKQQYAHELEPVTA